MQLKRLIKLIIILLSLSWLTPVQAHKVKIFATAAGDTITGYVYFPGGERAQAVAIKITTSDNQLQGTVTTDNNGEFQFHAKYRATYHLIANLGDGHLAQYTIDSNELSDTLSPLTTENVVTIPAALPAPPNTQNLSISEQQLHDLFEKMLSQQVKPLREQLEAYQDKILLHDVLGGIGYIFGVMGLLFYVAKRRRN